MSYGCLLTYFAYSFVVQLSFAVFAPRETSFWGFGTMSACPFQPHHTHVRPQHPPVLRVLVRRPVTPKVAPKATVRGPSHEPSLTQLNRTPVITAQALGSGKKSSPGSGSARGGASIPKAPHRSTPKSAALAGLDDTAANSPRASPPVAGAGAVAVEDVEVAMEGMALEAPASQDPKQRVLSQVNLAELPGTAGAGAEEARQILAGAPHTVPPEPCP